MKKVLSVMIALTTILSVLTVNSFNASAANYNPSAALDYAEDNWDNGIELCAGFVSNCIRAGGINIMERSVGNLYNALKGTYGTAYVLKTDGPYIYFEDNAGKLSPGDPVFYYCNSCKSFQHAILCGNGDDGGRMTDYAHNNPHHDTTTYISWGCPSCGDINWIMYSVNLSTSNSHQHSYKMTVTKKATCYSTGTETYTCSCGHSYTKTIPMTEHSTEWVYTKKPSVYNTGIKHMECTVCHKIVSSSSFAAKATADVNGDGKVNSADALTVLRYSTGSTSLISSQTSLINADTNGDGRINSSDALIILRISIGAINI
ncbi:putative uncharacterized protein [Ruminococcus sp. CAG:563]|nr:putative uncharacterized protein [Ruminococcus sp. CAG:563]